MQIRLVNRNDYDRWLEMRISLWPDCPVDEHKKEMKAILADFSNNPVFVCEIDGKLVGFVEASIHTYAPGCHTTPLGYIEGWYVEEQYRLKRIGSDLIEVVENWALSKGFKEVASDAEVFNHGSIAAHQKCGYRVVGSTLEEVKFVKEINVNEIVCNHPITGVSYKHRHSAYAVIFKHNLLAVVKLTRGYYMPGGGFENLENYIECIKRELLEEIGFECEVGDFICKSKEYYYSAYTCDFRVSEGYFYVVQLKEKVIEPTEKNHELVWVDLNTACNSLIPMFQREAIKFYKKYINC